MSWTRLMSSFITARLTSLLTSTGMPLRLPNFGGCCAISWDFCSGVSEFHHLKTSCGLVPGWRQRRCRLIRYRRVVKGFYQSRVVAVGALASRRAADPFGKARPIMTAAFSGPANPLASLGGDALTARGPAAASSSHQRELAERSDVPRIGQERDGSGFPRIPPLNCIFAHRHRDLERRFEPVGGPHRVLDITVEPGGGGGQQPAVIQKPHLDRLDYVDSGGADLRRSARWRAVLAAPRTIHAHCDGRVHHRR